MSHLTTVRGALLVATLLLLSACSTAGSVTQQVKSPTHVAQPDCKLPQDPGCA